MYEFISMQIGQVIMKAGSVVLCWKMKEESVLIYGAF